MLKTPIFEWKEFDNISIRIGDFIDQEYLVLLEDDNYDGLPLREESPNHSYHVDIATPFGSYIDSFWDTRNDWLEGNRCTVLAYAELPYNQKLEQLFPFDYDTCIAKKHLGIYIKGIKDANRREKLYFNDPKTTVEREREILKAYSQGYEDGTDNIYNAICSHFDIERG